MGPEFIRSRVDKQFTGALDHTSAETIKTIARRHTRKSRDVAETLKSESELARKLTNTYTNLVVKKYKEMWVEQTQKCADELADDLKKFVSEEPQILK